MRIKLPLIIMFAMILSSCLNGMVSAGSVFEYKPGEPNDRFPYIQETPSHVFYNDGSSINRTIGISEDFQYDKIKWLYLEELSEGEISQNELYTKTHWNISVSIVQKNSGGGGGPPCPPTFPYCNLPMGTSSSARINEESYEGQLYSLYAKHNSLGSPSGTTYLRISTSSSTEYGITAIELSTTITNITNFVKLNKGKLIVVVVSLRLNDTNGENNYIDVDSSVTLNYGYVIVYNLTNTVIHKNRAWTVIYTYLRIPENINNDEEDSSFSIHIIITADQYIENMKIDFDFVNIYLITSSYYDLVFPVSYTKLVKSLDTYVSNNWYRPPGAHEYGISLTSLKDNVHLLLDSKDYILIPLGRAYVIRLIEPPRVLYSDNNEKRIFIPVSTLVVVTTNTSSENYDSQKIYYIKIAESSMDLNDPLSGVTVRHSLRIEYPAITSMSIEGRKITINYNSKLYETGVKWGSPASSGSYSRHAYKTIIYNSSVQIMDETIYTNIENYEEAANIGTALSVASYVLGLVLTAICPPTGFLGWTLFLASATGGFISIWYDITEGGTIVVTRTISSGDVFMAGDKDYSQATIYVSYPSKGNGIDNIQLFFADEMGSLYDLERDYRDVVTNKSNEYYLFNVTQYLWYHTYSVPYDLFRVNPSLHLIKIGIERIHINYTTFMTIVAHNIDGEVPYLKVNIAERIVYEQVKAFSLYGERYGWTN